jgi:hypothetical protein
MRNQKRKKRNSRTRDFEAQNIRPLGIKILTVDRMKCIVKVANNLRISQKTKYQAMDLMEEVIDKKLLLENNLMLWQLHYHTCLH